METLGILGGDMVRPDHRIVTRDIIVDVEGGTIEDIVEPGAASNVDRTIDAEGGLVIPGLVNAHTHVAMTLLRGYADDKTLHAWLEEDIFPIEAELTAEDVAAGARLGMLEMIKGGTTTFCDMYFHEDAIADVALESGLRCLLGHGIITLGKDEAGIDDELETATAFIEDYAGRGDGRIQTALMPHAIRTVDPSTLERVAARAADLDVPIHLHCSETMDDIEAVVDRDGHRPVETAQNAGIFDQNAFIAHGVHLDTDELVGLAEAEVGIAHCPTANLKLASGIAPIIEAMDAGVTVGIGTDGPASNNDLDMLEELRLAALLAKVERDDATALPAEAAFDAATTAGASLLGFNTGRLEVGAPADIAVVDMQAPHFTPAHDLLSHLVYVASRDDVRHTIGAGEVLMRDREVIPFDEEQVRTAASSHAAAVTERAR